VARLTGPQRIEIADVPEPELLPGTVIVAIDRCGIGGSDIEAFSTGAVPAPAWFGHEWAGRVVAVGPGCVGRFEGERVVGAVPPPCGTCPPCRSGLVDACETVLAMIVGTHRTASPHGAFAERIRADARRVYRVPDGVEQSNAALAEPAAVAAHAVSRAEQKLGDLVAVIGAGTVGLLVAELARLGGAARVVAVDIEHGRRELACRLGADAAFAPGGELLRWLGEQGHGLGADVVYECAGRSEAVALSVQAVRPSGTVVVVGMSGKSGSVATSQLLERQLTLRASLGYTVTDVHRALDLMADDRFRVSAIHERLVGFDELASAFASLSTDSSARRKVLFSPTP
jgi:(R,R)-butanediol dehydrogenase/meso-butanediol dehydrogenase/diacetyl reductase